MISKEIEFIDLTNSQYEELIKMQTKAYKQIINYLKENIYDKEKLQIVNQQMKQIDERILTELEEMRAYNKVFMETIK